MKKLGLIIFILILAIGGYVFYKFSNAGGGDKGPKQAAISLKKHSEAFNSAVDSAMQAYFDMSAAFVDADTAKAKANCSNFIALLDSIPMAELEKDSNNVYLAAMGSYENIKANAGSLMIQNDITEMRKDFSMVSENLYPYFKLINYEGENLYWQNCPMAFDGDKEANWVSATKDIVNPYLGKNHPEYRGAMLHCGSIKDTIKAR